jgi:Fic family protein
MLIPPKYILTQTITKYLSDIESAKSIIDTITIPPEVETNIRRQSILKSSLFSARIEGNPLTLEEITTRPSKDQKKAEVYNILKSLELVRKRGARDVTQTFLLELHTKVMKGVSELPLGKYRTEQNAIFNMAGIAIYMPPPYRQIPALMERLLKFINSDKEKFIPIRAALAHYTFEKIHPFLDGNGRIGRLLFQEVLEKSGYGMKGLLSIEEQFDTRRSDYYDSLMEPERDVTSYVEFMLEALCTAAQLAKNQVLAKEKVDPTDFLLPRRNEILQIIKDHKLVNFDTIRRRFLKINERTLRYDLLKLQKAGLIKKLGTTKGVYYQAIRTSE